MFYKGFGIGNVLRLIYFCLSVNVDYLGIYLVSIYSFYYCWFRLMCI